MTIATIGPPPQRPTRAELVRAGILRVIAAGVCWPGFLGYPDRWPARPGAMPWWTVRQRVGGRVSAADFAAAVEGLLAEGRLIEVWLERRDGRSIPHLLMIPGCSEALSRPVAQARGKPEVLAAEPWYAGLMGDGPREHQEGSKAAGL